MAAPDDCRKQLERRSDDDAPLPATTRFDSDGTTTWVGPGFTTPAEEKLLRPYDEWGAGVLGDIAALRQTVDNPSDERPVQRFLAERGRLPAVDRVAGSERLTARCDG